MRNIYFEFLKENKFMNFEYKRSNDSIYFTIIAKNTINDTETKTEVYGFIFMSNA